MVLKLVWFVQFLVMVLWVVGSRRDFENFLVGLDGGKVRSLPMASNGELPSGVLQSGELVSPVKNEGQD